jgi:uncharacterized repeat protein (TIGR01451 family)
MVGTHISWARRGASAFLALLLALVGLAVIAPPASAANPLTIDKTSGPNPVASGGTLTYTIVVTNTGGSKVTEVSMTDVVNSLTGLDGTERLDLTSTVGSCGQTGNTVNCTAGTLQGFQQWTVTIRGKVTAANGTTLNNTASVTGTKSATTHTISDTVSTQVGSGSTGGSLPDLTTSVKGPVTTLPSHDMLYTVTVNNVGATKASDVVLTVTLPSTVTYATATATSLFNCNLPAGSTTLTCTGGAVNAGSNATVQVGVTAPSFDTYVTVSTAVDPFDAIAEANELNNASQATTQVSSQPPPGTLALEKTDASDPIAPNEILTYTLKLKNTSAYRADYIEVVDGTQGLEAASVSVTSSVAGTSVPLSCTVTAPKVTCTTTRFQSGATALITIKGLVIASPGSVILNTATVHGNIRNTGLTNTASTITSVRPSVDLNVTQHRTLPVAPEPVRAADRFDYTITVGNSGLYNASNVTVREPLPAGVFLDGFTATGGATCAADASQVVTCAVPQLKGANDSGNIGGSTETITLHLIAPQTKPSSAPSSALGPITSTVTVDPANAIPENDESNNTYTTTTDVVTGIDLTVAKGDSPDPVARNGTLRYTITVTNNGTQDATGVVVRDVLPTGSVFRTATDTVAGPAGEETLHNFTCAHSNGVVECVGGNIEGTYSGTGLGAPDKEATDFAVIVIDVFAPDEPGLYHNEVRVDPYGTIPEKDETNNLSFEDTVVENTHTGAGMYKELYISAIQETPEDPPAYATNGELGYDITVANAGQADAFNVVVRVKLPAGARYRSANDKLGASEGAFTCAHADNIVTCSGGTVKASSTRGIHVETFAPPAPGEALLLAIVDPNNAIGEADEANNTADEKTAIQAGEADATAPNHVQGTHIDLKVSKIVDSPDPVGTSASLDYDVTIHNTGAADAFGVVFRATLPTGSTFRSADDRSPGDASEAFTCVEASRVVTCSGGRVNRLGGARTVKINVLAQSQPTTSSNLAHFQAYVDPDNAIPEGHEGNNAADVTTKVVIDGAGGYIDLKIAKTSTVAPASITADGAVIPGGNIEYKLEVSNDGTDDAFNVAVRDPLPAGMQFVSAVPSAGSNFACVQAGGVIDCTGGYIQGTDSGGPTPPTRTITIKAKAPFQHGLEIVNQAFVDPTNAIAEQSEVNNTSTATNQVKSIVDLEVTMGNGSAGTASEGDWTFTAKNTGTDAKSEARNVVVVANFSSGTIHLNTATPNLSGWTCQVTQNPVNQVRCVGDFTPGAQSVDVKIHYYKTADEAINSFVEIDPEEDTSDGIVGRIVEMDEFDNSTGSTG